MSRKKSFRVRVRRRLLARFPFCYWCEKFLREYPPETYQQHKTFPDDMATIDHIYSRLNQGPRSSDYWVLSCRRCNEGRAAQEERELGIEELHRRSGHPPRTSW